MTEIIFGNSPYIFGISRDFFINILTSAIMGMISALLVVPFTARYIRWNDLKRSRAERLALGRSVCINFVLFLARIHLIAVELNRSNREIKCIEELRSELEFVSHHLRGIQTDFNRLTQISFIENDKLSHIIKFQEVLSNWQRLLLCISNLKTMRRQDKLNINLFRQFDPIVKAGDANENISYVSAINALGAVLNREFPEEVYGFKTVYDWSIADNVTMERFIVLLMEIKYSS